LWKRLHVQWRFAVLHLAQAMPEGGLYRAGQSRYVVLAPADPYDRPSDQLGNRFFSSAGTGALRGSRSSVGPSPNMVNLPLTRKWLFSAAPGPLSSAAPPYPTRESRAAPACPWGRTIRRSHR
jgi:hypothetical protein